VESVLREAGVPGNVRLDRELDRVFGQDGVIAGSEPALRRLFRLIDEWDNNGFWSSVNAPNNSSLSLGTAPSPPAPGGSAGWNILQRVAATAETRGRRSVSIEALARQVANQTLDLSEPRLSRLASESPELHSALSQTGLLDDLPVGRSNIQLTQSDASRMLRRAERYHDSDGSGDSVVLEFGAPPQLTYMGRVMEAFDALGGGLPHNERGPSSNVYDVRGLGTTLGLRNNSPWNMKGTGWEGASGADERGHSRFDDAAYSARAAAYQLLLYYTGESRAAGRVPLRTLEEIFGTYAPESDTVGSLPGRPRNDPNAYAQWVAEQMGIRPDADIRLVDGRGRIDPAVAVPLLLAIARYENVRSLELPDGLIEEGLSRLPERWAPA
ncbi:MAG: hypothetical protein AAFY60_00880, partial [Myxococcota bacterium]